MKSQKSEKISRRKLLQTAALSTGMLLLPERIAFAQRGGGRGRKAPPLPIAPDNPAIQNVKRNCRECGRCRDFCRNVTTVFGQPVPPNEEACIHCGQCTTFCKRFGLSEKYHYPDVARAIADRDMIVIASTSPAIRVGLGEMFRLAPGTNVEGKTVGALKTLGVDHVLDTTFAADLTVMEEASELIRRLENKGNDANAPLPLLTSCCPAWVRFAQLFYPKLLPNLSTAKSPVLMQGAMVKTYFAEKSGIDPSRIYHVALTPCTAKKAEILLPGMNAAGISRGKPEMRDVDAALTCRELAYLLNDGKVDLVRSQDASYDSLMGAGSGAGMIFGNTGGVAEATLRTAYRLLNGANPPQEFFELRPLRGFDSVRQASVDLGKRKLNVAVAHGIGRVRPLLEMVQKGERSFDLIEIMACPGGCIGGGGQPINHEIDPLKLRQHRIAALYQRDTKSEVRISCDNPEIKAVYAEFLGEPLGEKSERLLHLARG